MSLMKSALKITIIFLFISSITGYSLVQYQNDFADIVEPEEDGDSDDVIITKDEIEPIELKLKYEKEDKAAATIKNQNIVIMKALTDLTNRFKNLEEKEMSIKAELERTKQMLKEKNEISTKPKEEIKEKSNTDGFWNIICSLSKRILNGFLRFFRLEL